MPACSLPSCDQAGVVSWQRHATPSEAAEPSQDTEARHLVLFEQRKWTMRQGIKQLQEMWADPDFSATAKPNLERQIAAESALLDALVYEPLPPRTRPTLVAVYACRDHSITRDEAARLHESGCLTVGLCACLTDVNPLTCPMDPETLVNAQGDGFKD